MRGRIDCNRPAQYHEESRMTSKANEYVGDLILDYDDGHHHEEYTAEVTRASIVGDDWIVQFSGTDSDLGRYIGEMRLHCAGKTLKGQGTFRSDRQPAVTATINAKLHRKSKTQATCEGTWHEPGDASAYAMTLELVAARPQ
ncbi:MAG: hypothetical protein IPG63_07545 [Xanthomonadales bacterium]|nr:hypothetical protein [Xanthomonadales bacterium]MCC6561330.1 hypothetical protein [Xanthomonadales bacterium]